MPTNPPPLDPRLRGRAVRSGRLNKGLTQWQLAELMQKEDVAAHWTGMKVSYVELFKRQVQPDEVEPLERILGVKL